MPKSQLFERLQVNHATTIPSRTSCSLVVTHFVPGTFLIGCLQQSYSFTAEMNLFFFSHQNEQFFIAKANNVSNVKTSTFSPRSSANRTGSDSTPIQGSAFRLIPVKKIPRLKDLSSLNLNAQGSSGRIEKKIVYRFNERAAAVRIRPHLARTLPKDFLILKKKAPPVS